MLTAKQFVKKIFEDVKSNWFLPVTEHQVYSTTETIVGVWTDGKPLYRKVIVIDSPTNGTNYPHNISNIKEIVNVVGATKLTDLWTSIAYSHPKSNNTENQYNVTWLVNSTSVSARIGTGQTVASAVVTIEYTKTTDTASSPKVPFEPLVEYSTEEKLIGYWVDGKPIYRKTVDCGALTEAGTTKNVAHGIDNLECVIKFDGYAYNSSSGTSIPLPRVGFDNNVFVEVTANATNIIIRPKTNHSTYVRSHVTLYYTKTT